MHKDHLSPDNPDTVLTTPSNVLKAVIADFKLREAVGLGKYGTTLDRPDFTHEQYLQHALEEAMDLCMYLKGAQLRTQEEKSKYARLRYFLENFDILESARHRIDLEEVLRCFDSREALR